MRLLILLVVISVGVAACAKESKPAAQEEQKDPVFVGDPNAPLEVRVYKEAKQVKKQVEEQRKVDKKTLQEAD
jgi:hypothetical protein